MVQAGQAAIDKARYEAERKQDKELKEGNSTVLNWSKVIVQLATLNEDALGAAISGNKDELLNNAERMSNIEFAISIGVLIAFNRSGKFSKTKNKASFKDITESKKFKSKYKNPTKALLNSLKENIESYNKLSVEEQMSFIDSSLKNEKTTATNKYNKNKTPENLNEVNEVNKAYSKNKDNMGIREERFRNSEKERTINQRKSRIEKLQDETGDVRNNSDFIRDFKKQYNRNPGTDELFNYKLGELIEMKESGTTASRNQVIDRWNEEFGMSNSRIDTSLQSLANRVMRSMDENADGNISEPPIMGTHINSLGLTARERAGISEAFNNPKIWKVLKNNYKKLILGIIAGGSVTGGSVVSGKGVGGGDIPDDSGMDPNDEVDMNFNEDISDDSEMGPNEIYIPPKFIRDGLNPEEQSRLIREKLFNEQQRIKNLEQQKKQNQKDILNKQRDIKKNQEIQQKLKEERLKKELYEARLKKEALEAAAAAAAAAAAKGGSIFNTGVSIGPGAGSGDLPGSTKTETEPTTLPNFKIKETVDVLNIDRLLTESLEISSNVYDGIIGTSNYYILDTFNSNLSSNSRIRGSKSLMSMPVLFSRQGNKLYIGFRGTASVSNVLNDMNVSNIMNDDNNFLYNYANLNAALDPHYANIKCFPGVLNTLNEIYPTIRAEMDKYHGTITQIILNGHSLGGATASLFYYVYINDINRVYNKIKNVRCVSFGSPRFLITEYFDLYSGSCTNLIRVFNRNDIITYVPLNKVKTYNFSNITSGYIHVGFPLCLDSKKNEENTTNELIINILQGQQDKIELLLKGKDTVLGSKLIQFMMSDKYKTLILDTTITCASNIEIKSSLTNDMIIHLEKELRNNIEKLSSWTDKCKLLSPYRISEILENTEIGEDEEQKNFTISSIFGAALGFNKLSVEAHSRAFYKTNLLKRISEQIDTNEDILNPSEPEIKTNTEFTTESIKIEVESEIINKSNDIILGFTKLENIQSGTLVKM